MLKKEINSTEAPSAIGPYSQAIQAGDLLFCSGQIPLNPKTGKLIEGAVEDDVHQIFSNIKAVLSAAGVGLENVVKTTIFLKDIGSFAQVNEVYGQYFQKPYPARSTVQVAKLPLDCRVEIEVVAKI